MTSDPFDYESLDPGIRGLVRLLRHSRFDTTDSGDGVSKPLEHRVLHFPHVFCRTDPGSLIGECDRMREVLIEAGLFASDRAIETETVETPEGVTSDAPASGQGFPRRGVLQPGRHDRGDSRARRSAARRYMTMLPLHVEQDTPEIRLIRTINDLCYRLLYTTEASARTELRGIISALRTELGKLVEAMPIPSEEQVRQTQERSGMATGVLIGQAS
jgi:hypothetical protein